MNAIHVTVRDPQRGFLCFADHPTPARYLAHHLGEKLDDELRNIVSTELGVNRRARDFSHLRRIRLGGVGEYGHSYK